MSLYVINVLASRDLIEIADYFAETNVEVGERFFREFNSKCQQLVSFPSSGKSYGAIRLPPVGYANGSQRTIPRRLYYFLPYSR
jgi:plasmid stabilization system protein ParE